MTGYTLCLTFIITIVIQTFLGKRAADYLTVFILSNKGAEYPHIMISPKYGFLNF